MPCYTPRFTMLLYVYKYIYTTCTMLCLFPGGSLRQARSRRKRAEHWGPNRVDERTESIFRNTSPPLSRVSRMLCLIAGRANYFGDTALPATLLAESPTPIPTPAHTYTHTRTPAHTHTHTHTWPLENAMCALSALDVEISDTKDTIFLCDVININLYSFATSKHQL